MTLVDFSSFRYQNVGYGTIKLQMRNIIDYFSRFSISYYQIALIRMFIFFSKLFVLKSRQNSDKKRQTKSFEKKKGLPN